MAGDKQFQYKENTLALGMLNTLLVELGNLGVVIQKSNQVANIIRNTDSEKLLRAIKEMAIVSGASSSRISSFINKESIKEKLNKEGVDKYREISKLIVDLINTSKKGVAPGKVILSASGLTNRYPSNIFIEEKTKERLYDEEMAKSAYNRPIYEKMTEIEDIGNKIGKNILNSIETGIGKESLAYKSTTGVFNKISNIWDIAKSRVESTENPLSTEEHKKRKLFAITFIKELENSRFGNLIKSSIKQLGGLSMLYGAGQLFGGNLAGIIPILGGALIFALPPIISGVIQGMTSTLGVLITGIIRKLSPAILGLIAGAVTSIGVGIVGAFDAVRRFSTGKWGTGIMSALQSIALVVGGISTIVTGAWAPLLIAGITTAVLEVGKWIGDSMADKWDDIFGPIGNFIRGIWEFITAKSIGERVQQVGSLIKDTFTVEKYSTNEGNVISLARISGKGREEGGGNIVFGQRIGKAGTVNTGAYTKEELRGATRSGQIPFEVLGGGRGWSILGQDKDAPVAKRGINTILNSVIASDPSLRGLLVTSGSGTSGSIHAGKEKGRGHYEGQTLDFSVKGDKYSKSEAEAYASKIYATGYFSHVAAERGRDGMYHIDARVSDDALNKAKQEDKEKSIERNNKTKVDKVSSTSPPIIKTMGRDIIGYNSYKSILFLKNVVGEY